LRKLLVSLAALASLVAFIPSAGASAATNPPASDGFQNTCVITHKMLTSNTIIQEKMNIGGTYDPDGGLGPFSCTTQLNYHCSGGGWGPAWFWAQAATATSTTPATYTNNYGPFGCTIDDWALRLTNISDGAGHFWTFLSSDALGWRWQ
jgi:hypothetical protein